MSDLLSQDEIDALLHGVDDVDEDEVGDSDDAELVLGGEALEVRHAGHRAVVVHQLTEHRRRTHAGENRQIERVTVDGYIITGRERSGDTFKTVRPAIQDNGLIGDLLDNDGPDRNQGPRSRSDGC